MDEKEGEAGIIATLNLGHTFGHHPVETGMGYGTWLYGEAVSVGTAMASDLSKRLGWINEGLRERLFQTIFTSHRLRMLQHLLPKACPCCPPPASGATAYSCTTRAVV